MNTARDTYKAAIKLAAVLSVIAIALAIGLESIGDVSPGLLVAVVATVGFTTSWVLTGRLQRAHSDVLHHHRVSVIRVHHHVG